MKFVCLTCETYMNFEKVEQPAQGSLGVFFRCPSCEAKFSMVTKPRAAQPNASQYSPVRPHDKNPIDGRSQIGREGVR